MFIFLSSSVSNLVKFIFFPFVPIMAMSMSERVSSVSVNMSSPSE